jgi:UDP-N-acetylglucosamine 2-epimerase (non-hydrolysing)
VHVEAGLRSFDESMPEERNRIAADRMSSVLFSPTELAKRFLNEEGIEEKIFIVGNTIVDAVNHFSGRAKESGILEELDLDSEEYILATVHRQENVDTKENLVKFVKAFEQINKKIIFPIHPRTTKKLKDFGLVFSHNVRLINPVGYFDFLHLMQNAALVMTDSGGVQEEAIVLNVPCLTLRNTTERWETIEAGGNLLAGLDPLLISYYAKMIIETDFSKKMRLAKNPYGDGTTSEKIAKILQDVE